MPRAAATGTLSATRPIRTSAVTPSMSAPRRRDAGKVFQLLADFLVEALGPGQTAHPAQVAGEQRDQRAQHQQHPDRHEKDHAGEPEGLRHQQRNGQRGRRMGVHADRGLDRDLRDWKRTRLNSTPYFATRMHYSTWKRN